MSRSPEDHHYPAYRLNPACRRFEMVAGDREEQTKSAGRAEPKLLR